MGRKKKIGFKYYLNKRLKNVGVKEPAYPLYVRVTFDGKDAKIPPKEGFHYHFTEKWLARFESREKVKGDNFLKNLFIEIREQETVIETIIRHEYNRNSKFSITGLGKLLGAYQENLLNLLTPIIGEEFKSDIATFLIANKYLEVIKYEEEDDLEPMITYLLTIRKERNLKPLLKERTIILLQCYAGLVEYITQLRLNSARDLNSSAYAWVFEGGKNNFRNFLKNIELKNTETTLIKIFIPEKEKTEEYVQIVDNEINKYLIAMNR